MTTDNRVPESSQNPSASSGPAVSNSTTAGGAAYGTAGSPPAWQPPEPPQRRRGSGAALPWLLFVLVSAGAGIGGWSLNQKLDRVQQELARRQQAGDAQVMQAQVRTAQALDNQHDLQNRLTALEGRVSDSRSQQAALEQLYQDLAHNRDEWVLAETEQIVMSANQQLQLTGNVRGALIALEGADARLARSGAPQLAGVRDALKKDIDRLKAVPAADLPQLTGKLDQAIAMVDTLPLQAEEQRAESAVGAAGSAGGASGASEAGWIATWHRLSAEMLGSLKQLVQVRRLDDPDVMLVAPEQGAFLRANLKLRLLNARLALLARNASAVHSDVVVAQAALDKYFDAKSRRIAAVKTLLDQVDAGSRTIELPTLDASLTAIGQVKDVKDKP
ncbi:Putative uroporphyrinogen-III C-methyltransferase [Pandoraea eparura]|jgi:uroporphyrinogen III methyltransferase/synthase|uniref:Uroporphyrinogen-III C-methyltransferase n=1 Tax=Pandoraea eparura TaxID=2508291 RepID=A0A5E4VTC9_9BURK|nr:uroporphyrinogen-III C-methyltransferase [Pandoraea eparura]VVE14330.1 Putative uroporphyrinogen-III C-methyltransferase [Pandoraea eparura]